MNILVPNQLQAYTGGQSRVTADGGTLAEVLADLDTNYPGIRFRMIDEQDRIREHIRIFVAGENAASLDVPVPRGVEVQIVGALSGG